MALCSLILLMCCYESTHSLIRMLSLCRMVCARLVFSQSLLSLDLIEDFLALKTDEAQRNAASDSVVSYQSVSSHLLGPCL